MLKIFLSFDDGFLDQFKWARALFSYQIKGTFYINPYTLDSSGYLKMWQLKKMHDEWGHIIANHLWSHECPVLGLTELAVAAEFEATRQWLCDNGFEDGSMHVALPFGSQGGGWTLESIRHLEKLADSVRDAGVQTQEVIDNTSMIWAQEITSIDLDGSDICARSFHQYPNLKDDDFLAMLEMIDDLREQKKVETISIQEVAYVSTC